MKKKLLFGMILIAGFGGTVSAQTGRTVETPKTVEVSAVAASPMSKLAPLNLTDEQKERAVEVMRTYYPTGLRTLSKIETAQRDQAVETLLYPNQVTIYRATVAPSFTQN